jgi:hypothetical protein
VTLDRKYYLSKTSFLKFEQCEKAFFLHSKHPYLKDKVSTDKMLTFRRGHEVGFYARNLFPGGQEGFVEGTTIEQALARTQELLQQNIPVIYEAAFVFNGVLVIVDILTQENNCYTAYEVKSSFKVSDTYLKDAYLQYYILKNSLPVLEDLFLVTLNPDYVRGPDLEAKKLFRKRSVKEKAEENFPYFEFKISRAAEVLERNAIPDIVPGIHCFQPYQCDFFGTCWKDKLTESTIFNMPLINKHQLFDWHDSGIRNLEDIPDARLSKQVLINIRNSLVSGKEWINHSLIRSLMGEVKGKVAAFDIEVWAPAIPQLEGSRPFQQVPFLICLNDGVKDDCFLTDHFPDDKREFADKLVNMTRGYDTLLAYDKTLEVSVIRKLAENFPDLAQELLLINDRTIDLFDIILNVGYYHPGFTNNFSLKTVSGVITGENFYTGISSGLEAINVYESWRAMENPIEKDMLRTSLVDYCAADAHATYRLYEFFTGLIK